MKMGSAHRGLIQWEDRLNILNQVIQIMDLAAVKELLKSSAQGDRIRVINEARKMDAAVAFDLVAPLTKDQNVRVRYAAVSFMASVGQVDLERSLAILRSGLADAEPDVQAAAADAIAGLRLTEAFEDLRSLYEATPEWLVQFSIVAALGELGDPRGFELLEQAIGAENELLQTAAVGSMGELKDTRAIPYLVPMADHPDWQMRFRVADALGHFDGIDALAALRRLASDPEAQVAERAQTALASIAP
jgi:HEAT repeat protein